MNRLEDTIKEPRKLAKKKPLTQAELERVKELMKKLRKMDFKSEKNQQTL